MENVAIDLSWDIMLRFDEKEHQLPKEFFDDWIRIAYEEGKHHLLLKKRLEEEYKKSYGDFPVHANLWEQALETKDNLVKRLILEHCIHEARGLDITSLKTIPGFK